MLSGIGPAAHLREFGIDVVADSPGVGSNLDDHVEGIVQWDAAKPMIRTSTQWWEIGLFSTSEPGLDRPDLMMHYGSVPFDMNTMRWGYPTTENGFCLTPNVCRGRSRGTVRLRTRDFRDRARVDPRYFTDPEGHDEQVMLYGVKLARKIVSQPAMAEWAARELAPGPDAVSDDELIDYIHKTHNTVYHPACTAHMGPDSDPEAVVDPRLRVRGVQGLRVADGSVMPFLPAINPCITTMMIGEKCADMLIQDARATRRRARRWRAADRPRGGRGRRLPAPPPAVRRARRRGVAARRRRRRGRGPSRAARRSSPRGPSQSAPADRAQRSGRARRSTGACWICRASASSSGRRRCSRGCRRASRRAPSRTPSATGSRPRSPAACSAVPRRSSSSRGRCWTAGASRAGPTTRRRDAAPAHQPVAALARRAPDRVPAADQDPRRGAADDRGPARRRSSSTSAARSGSSPIATCARASWGPGCPTTRPSPRR